MNNHEESFEKDKQIIIDLVKENLQITFAGEIETFQKLWHPKAHRFGLGNSNELYSFSRAELCEHMQQLTAAKKDNPSLAQIEIIFDEIDFINIHQNLIASVAVKWHMNMPDSMGKHYTYYHLAKQDNTWQIVNALDRGFEYKEE
ncbi:MAG: nuclear transport factor 2 family protein [Candidatus Heimdallarchaeota archaeon]